MEVLFDCLSLELQNRIVKSSALPLNTIVPLLINKRGKPDILFNGSFLMPSTRGRFLLNETVAIQFDHSNPFLCIDDDESGRIFECCHVDYFTLVEDFPKNTDCQRFFKRDGNIYVFVDDDCRYYKLIGCIQNTKHRLSSALRCTCRYFANLPVPIESTNVVFNTSTPISDFLYLMFYTVH